MYYRFTKKLFQAPVAIESIGVSMKQTLLTNPAGNYNKHIMWVVEGKMSINICGKDHILNKGEGIFIHPKIPIEYFPTDSDVLYVSWLNFLNGKELLEYYKVPDYLIFRCPERINDTLSELHDFALTCTSPPLLSAECFKWLVNLFEEIHPRELEKVDEINLYLKRNFFRQITLEEIAEYFETDKYTLCRLYKKETGDTVMNRLRNIRIFQAKQLLWQTTMPIEEIARVCGYLDTSYFIKNFKLVTGNTPKKYKDMVTRTKK